VSVEPGQSPRTVTDAAWHALIENLVGAALLLAVAIGQPAWVR
jgi:hypothetical protein